MGGEKASQKKNTETTCSWVAPVDPTEFMGMCATCFHCPPPPPPNTTKSTQPSHSQAIPQIANYRNCCKWQLRGKRGDSDSGSRIQRRGRTLRHGKRGRNLRNNNSIKGRIELFGPHPFTWKTPTPLENIRTKKFGFGFFFPPGIFRPLTKPILNPLEVEIAGWLRNPTGTGNRSRRNRFSRNRKRNRNRRNRFPGTETGTGTVLSC